MGCSNALLIALIEGFNIVLRTQTQTAFLLLLVFGLMGRAVIAQDTGQEVEYFEAKIRPLLVERCLECHSTDTEASGGLLLDSQQGWAIGGDSGAAIVPGEPDASLLIKAIEYSDLNLQMPPDGKLSPDEIESLRRWIAEGAIDPRSIELGSIVRNSTALPLERAQDHWAYRPLTDPAIPVATSARSASPIDAFIDQRLSESGIEATESVSRRALLRRLSFDLHGLPPSPAEMMRFELDTRPDAVARQVDRMLASPRVGERLGRHWLDVARYGESLTLRGLVLPNAWRYRQFVIDSFDLDLPFDLFVQQQIAGDLLAQRTLTQSETPPLGLSNIEWAQHQVAATSYLALGNSNLEEQDKRQLEMDIIDEQLDVIGKGLLGQTISCARCHDHKFDPIPTADYYALAGILKGVQTVRHANVSEWIDIELPIDAQLQEQLAQAKQQTESLRAELKSVELRIAELKARLDGKLPSSLVNEPVPTEVFPGIVLDDSQASAVGDWTFSQYFKGYIGEGYRHDGNEKQGTKTLTFAPDQIAPGRYEIRFAYNHGDSRSSNVLVTVFSADGEKEVVVNQKQAPQIDGRWTSLGEYRFEQGGQAHLIISNANANGHVIVDAIQFLPLDAPSDEVDSTIESQLASSDESTRQLALELEQLEGAKQQLLSRIAEHESLLASQPRAVGVIETGAGADLPIHIRGSVHNLGSVVPRGFPRMVLVGTSPPQTTGSGRVELAQWLTADDQPLTHRVFANRLWLWTMGQGLVRTPDNFGTTGESPTHPELLEYLVQELRDNETHPKALIRKLLLTDVYARSISTDGSRSLADPENRMWWRGELRRLDAESLRDSMLAVSDELWLRRGDQAPPAKLKEDYGYRALEPVRSVYLPAFRNATFDLLSAFDVADPSVVVGQRNRSTVAPQALQLLHNEWVHERADHAARFVSELAVVEARQVEDPVMRRERLIDRFIDLSCERAWGRLPMDSERDSLRAALIELDFGARFEQSSDEPQSLVLSPQDHNAAVTVMHAILNSIDFRFLE